MSDQKRKTEEEVLRDTIEKLGEVFQEFKSSYEGKIVKNGSLGSSNPHNVLKAVVQGLKSQSSPKNISAMRNKKIAEIIKKREN